MNYTPFAHLTDKEFIAHLSFKEAPTDEEIESMVRLESATEYTEDLIAVCERACIAGDLLSAKSLALRQRSEAARARSNDLFGPRA